MTCATLAFAAPMPPETEKPKTLQDRALESTKYLSEKIEDVATSIDITLAGKKYTKKVNHSAINLSQLISYSEGGDTRLSTDFGVNLRLPNLEKRWQLRFASYDEEREDRDLSQRQVRTRARPREYGASFQFFQSLGKVKTTFQPRLEIRDPVEMSYVLRFESETNISKVRVVPRTDFFTDPEKGTGQFASVEFQYKLSARSDLRFYNNEEYRDFENYFTTQHGLSYDFSLSKVQAIGISAVATSNNRPTFHLQSFSFAVPFARELSRELLTFSLTPFIGFGKGEKFKGRTGISLYIEMTL